MIQKHKARPDQARFFRRLLAFLADNLIITLVSLVIFFGYSEITAARRGEKGDFSKIREALKQGDSVVVGRGEIHPPAEAATSDGRQKKLIAVGGEKFNIIYEFLVGYVYYILFFRFSGRTPGKRLLRLRVVDLEGRPRLGWYQSLERAHGYAASTMLVFLGFLQVLWDREGLTMHDKLAGTTVIRVKRSG